MQADTPPKKNVSSTEKVRLLTTDINFQECFLDE